MIRSCRVEFIVGQARVRHPCKTPPPQPPYQALAWSYGYRKRTSRKSGKSSRKTPCRTPRPRLRPRAPGAPGRAPSRGARAARPIARDVGNSVRSVLSVTLFIHSADRCSRFKLACGVRRRAASSIKRDLWGARRCAAWAGSPGPSVACRDTRAPRRRYRGVERCVPLRLEDYSNTVQVTRAQDQERTVNIRE